ncbi:hypothetical protein P7C73_g3892, partial [Tremellales sp. Uapishka_1]
MRSSRCPLATSEVAYLDLCSFSQASTHWRMVCVFCIRGQHSRETNSSKYAAFGMAVFDLFCIFLAVITMPKYAFEIAYYDTLYLLSRLLCWSSRAAQYKRKLSTTRKNMSDVSGVDDDEPTAKDKMVSVITILWVNMVVAAIMGVTWYFQDAIWLRFFIMGMGTMSALYAVADVVIDGVIHEASSSDCTAMAEEFNMRRNEKNQKSTSYYAWIWMTASVVCILIALIGGIYAFTDDMAQQAINSRKFLPTANHYSATALWESAEDAI